MIKRCINALRWLYNVFSIASRLFRLVVMSTSLFFSLIFLIILRNRPTNFNSFSSFPNIANQPHREQ